MLTLINVINVFDQSSYSGGHCDYMHYWDHLVYCHLLFRNRLLQEVTIIINLISKAHHDITYEYLFYS